MHYLLADHIERLLQSKWGAAGVLEMNPRTQGNPWRDVLAYIDGMQDIVYKIDGVDSESMELLKDVWIICLYRMTTWRTL